MQIGSLFIKIGIKGGKESVATMGQLKNTTLATKAAVVAAVVAFAKMSQEARKLAMNLDIFEKTTGLSGGTLQKMSYQAAAAGVNLSDLDSTLQTIQQRMIDISLGQGDIAPFQLWGIGLDKDPTKVLDQIAEKINVLQKKSPAMAAKMARDFGLSNSMLYYMLNKQTEQIDGQYLLKRKDKEMLVALNREWYKLLWYVKQISVRSQGFLSYVALPIVKALVRIVKSVGEIVISFGEAVKYSKGLQKTLAVIGLLVAAILAWCFPITAAIIGIALVLEDVYGYFTGKDSITGRMIEWIKSGQIIKDIFMTIAEILRTISNMLFGRKFTRAVSRLLNIVPSMAQEAINGQANKEGGQGIPGLSGVRAFKPFQFIPNVADFAKPNIVGGRSLNVTQNITAQFEQRSAAEDGERVGELTNQCSWAAYQKAGLAHP